MDKPLGLLLVVVFVTAILFIVAGVGTAFGIRFRPPRGEEPEGYRDVPVSRGSGVVLAGLGVVILAALVAMLRGANLG